MANRKKRSTAELERANTEVQLRKSFKTRPNRGPLSPPVKKKKDKRNAESIVKKFDQKLRLTFNRWNLVRDPSTWKCSTFNSDRQLLDLARWSYCRYKVPEFILTELFLTEKPTTQVREPGRFTYEECWAWFRLIGSGGSFAKSVKDLMSKKEAHAFLTGRNDYDVRQNILLAKCKVRGISTQLTHKIINRRIDPDKFWDSAFDFIGRYEKDIDLETFDQILDFFYRKHLNDLEFSLRKRTISSIIKLTNEWHVEQQKIKSRRHENNVWDGIPVDNWQFEEAKTGVVYTIKQILSAKDLGREGDQQKHCVYGLLHTCIKGYAGIFSLKSTNTDVRLTIEVTDRRVVTQIKGKLNRRATKFEMSILRQWSNSRNLKLLG